MAILCLQTQVKHLSSWCAHPHQGGVDNTWTPDALHFIFAGRAEKGRDWDNSFEEPCEAWSSKDRWCDEFQHWEKLKSRNRAIRFVSTKLWLISNYSYKLWPHSIDSFSFDRAYYKHSSRDWMRIRREMLMNKLCTTTLRKQDFVLFCSIYTARSILFWGLSCC